VRGAGHKKDKEDKEDKGIDPEKGIDQAQALEKQLPTGTRSPLLSATEMDDLDHELPKSPDLPRTPTLHKNNHPTGLKDWSTMLDGKPFPDIH